MSGNLTIAQCLTNAVAAGRLTQAGAEDAQRRLQERMERDGIEPGTAAARVAEEMALAAAAARRQAAQRIIAAESSVRIAGSHQRGFAAGVAALFARDVWGQLGGVGIEGRMRAVMGEAHSRFLAGLDAFRSRNLGLTRDLPGLRDLVREHYAAGSTGNQVARGAADAWRETEGFLTTRFNHAGGNLPPRANYFPQQWDHARVAADGQQAFTRWMRGEFDAGRLTIRSFETSERMQRDLAYGIIDDAWQRISTNGLSDLVPGQFQGSANLANRHNHARVFEWTSSDAWLGFNDRYGVGDAGIYDLLTGHISGRSREIAMMEVLGPNHGQMARMLIDTARQRGTTPFVARRLEAIWDQVSGAAHSPVSEWMATSMRGVRSWLSAAKLGSATLSAVTDFATIRQTAAWNGMHTTGVMRRYLSLLNPANADDRQLAVRLGLIADGWAQRASAGMRDQVEVGFSDLAGRVTDTVLRASGLSAHTQAGKWAFGMEMLGYLADNAGRTLDQLDPRLQRAFRSYGIDAAAWDRVRTAGLFEEDGARFIFPEQAVRALPADAPPADVAATRQAASRVLEMVQTETNFAVVEPGALERAMILGNYRAGTLAGEFIRSTMQFKTFPVSMMTRHLMRGAEAIRAGDRGRYMAATGVSLTVMGALAMQLKAVAQGKDPRDTTDPRFWGAAFMQGGGSGLFGDFLFSAVSRADRGFWMATFGGPTAGLVDDFARLTGGNIQGLAEQKNTNVGRELARFIQFNTPGSSLWYARLALDRLVWDQMQMHLDPDYPTRFRRMEDRARRDFGQEFFWRPGTSSPDRAPSIAAAIGGRPD